MILRKGPSNNIGVVGTIADSIQDSGSFLWNIPSNLVSGNDYAVEIIVGPASNVANVGPDGYNFTPLLPLVSNYTGPSNSTTTASSSMSVLSSTTASAQSAASSAAASAPVGTPEVTSPAETATTSTTKAAAATATHASAAIRIDGSLMCGHGFFALILALAVGIVASF